MSNQMIQNKTILDFYKSKSEKALITYGFDPLRIKYYSMSEGMHTKGDSGEFLRENFPCCYSSHFGSESAQFFTIYAVESNIIAN